MNERTRSKERWKRILWVAVFICGMLGLSTGLALTWVLWPVDYFDTDPVDLRAEVKQEYLLLISSSFNVEDDLDHARKRLGWLGLGDDGDASRSLAGLTKTYSELGMDVAATHGLSKLAYALGARDSQVLVFMVTPTSTVTPTPTSTATPTITMTPTETPLLPAIVPTSTQTPKTRTTPRTLVRTDTPTPTPMTAYEVVDNLFSCLPVEELKGDWGLLEVRVEDVDGEPQEGTALSITWEDDEDMFFSGLKPDEGPGYADFDMRPGFKYLLTVSRDKSEPVALSFREKDCVPDSSGPMFPVWQVVFRERSDS